MGNGMASQGGALNQAPAPTSSTLTERVMQLTQENMDLRKALNEATDQIFNRLAQLESKVG